MTSEKAQKMSRQFWDNMTDEEFECYREKKRQENLNQPEEIKEFRKQKAKEWFNELHENEKDRIRNHLENYRRDHWQNLTAEERSKKIRLEKNPRFKHEINEKKVRQALIDTG